MGPVIIVSGPPGAGKTTAAGLVADRYPRSVHLMHDWFFEAIRQGFIEPWKTEASEQNEIVVRAATEAARVFVLGGYVVVIDGVVLPWALSIYRAALSDLEVEPVLVALLPRVELLLARGPGRIRLREPDTAAYESLHQQFMDSGLPVLDTSTLTPEQVADTILAFPPVVRD